jgi:hypothetical protein
MQSRWYAGLALVAAVALAAACNDTPSSPGTGLLEGVRFQYSGDTSGTFQAGGNPTLDGDGSVSAEQWTAAQLDSLGGLVLASFRPSNSEAGDLFILQLAPAQVDEWTCGTGTVDGRRCHGRMLMNISPDAFSPSDYFEVVSGSAAITEITSSRVKGTFALRARSDHGFDDREIVLSNGQFDAPIVGGATGNAVACVVERVTSGTDDPCAEGWNP